LFRLEHERSLQEIATKNKRWYASDDEDLNEKNLKEAQTKNDPTLGSCYIE